MKVGGGFFFVCWVFWGILQGEALLGFWGVFFARPLQDACFCLLSHNVNDENSYVQLNIGKEPLRATTS